MTGTLHTSYPLSAIVSFLPAPGRSARPWSPASIRDHELKTASSPPAVGQDAVRDIYMCGGVAALSRQAPHVYLHPYLLPTSSAQPDSLPASYPISIGIYSPRPPAAHVRVPVDRGTRSILGRGVYVRPIAFLLVSDCSPSPSVHTCCLLPYLLPYSLPFTPGFMPCSPSSALLSEAACLFFCVSRPPPTP